MKKIVIIFVFIAVITLFFIENHYSQITTNGLYNRLNETSEIESLDIIILNDRDLLKRPNTFVVKLNISDSLSSKLFMFHFKCGREKIKKAVLVIGEEEEDLTPFITKRELNKWFRSMRRELRRVPSGKYSAGEYQGQAYSIFLKKQK
jgi:hypothetical protein